MVRSRRSRAARLPKCAKGKKGAQGNSKGSPWGEGKEVGKTLAMTPLGRDWNVARRFLPTGAVPRVTERGVTMGGGRAWGNGGASGAFPFGFRGETEPEAHLNARRHEKEGGGL